MRNIDENIWRDDWFAELDVLGQLIWIGLLSKVADDQGRLRHNAELVKSDLFPMSKNPTPEAIEICLEKFIADGKLLSYELGGKKYLQIANWWKYQGSSNFMSASQYPAPEGWQDCYRYHGKGNAELRSPNWSTKQAGFSPLSSPLCSPLSSPLCSPLSSPLPSPLCSGNGSNDVNDNDNDNKEVEAGAKKETFCSAATALSAITAASGLPAVPPTEMQRLDQVAKLIQAYGKEKTISALREACSAWIKTKREKGGGTYAIVNLGWVDWGMSSLTTGQKQWAHAQPPPPPKIIPVETELMRRERLGSGAERPRT